MWFSYLAPNSEESFVMVMAISCLIRVMDNVSMSLGILTECIKDMKLDIEAYKSTILANYSLKEPH